MSQILLLNGPNLNLLGIRQPKHYGQTTLDEITRRLVAKAQSLGHQLQCMQSNREHELVEKIHQAAVEQVRFIIINPAALTHSSITIRDALLAVNIPFIEVHLSNIYAREAFRRHSYFSDIAFGVICGLGAQGYDLALQAANQALQDQIQD